MTLIRNWLDAVLETIRRISESVRSMGATTEEYEAHDTIERIESHRDHLEQLMSGPFVFSSQRASEYPSIQGRWAQDVIGRIGPPGRHFITEVLFLCYRILEMPIAGNAGEEALQSFFDRDTDRRLSKWQNQLDSILPLV